MDLIQAIKINNENIGFLVIETSFHLLYESIISLVEISAMVFLLIMLLVYILSLSFQRRITGPMRKLVSGIQQVSDEKDFKLRLESDENDEIVLNYQPQIDVKSGMMTGVEALVRWNHPQKGIVSPAEFMNIAERIGGINALGQWVLRKACSQAAEWRDLGLPAFQIAVNISPIHFKDPSIVDTLQQVLKETGWEAKHLELEVAESVVQTISENLNIFSQFRDLGLKISIDDFGTGYSTLASLKHLPIDCLKIDRLFIIDMLDDADSSILLGTIIGVAHALEHSVVAEGVEEAEQVRVLSGIGCDTIQGYYFSRPVAAEEIPVLAKKKFDIQEKAGVAEILALAMDRNHR